MLHGSQLMLSEAARKEAFSKEYEIPNNLKDVIFTPHVCVGGGIGGGVGAAEEDATRGGGGRAGGGGGVGRKGYLTMAAIERRSRYLPLDVGYSALYSGSTAQVFFLRQGFFFGTIAAIERRSRCLMINVGCLTLYFWGYGLGYIV